MQLLKDIATLGQLPALLTLKKGMKPRPADVADCFGARVESNAKQLGNHSAIVCEGKELNWIQFNALANQYASAFKSQGLARNDTVCVMMENRVEFLALLVGLNKLGVTAGLLNTNLTGRSLQHCINVIKAKKMYLWRRSHRRRCRHTRGTGIGIWPRFSVCQRFSNQHGFLPRMGVGSGRHAAAGR